MTCRQGRDGSPVVPRIKPGLLEDLGLHVFRETFLLFFTRAGDAAAFRAVGSLLFEMSLEFRQYFPRVDSMPRRELQAALADLRYLEDYLGSYLGPTYPFAAEIAEQVRTVADRLDRKLRNRKQF